VIIIILMYLSVAPTMAMTRAKKSTTTGYARQWL
jgi:hypothetical protein